MNFEDLIGFIISIAAFIFLMIRSALKNKQTNQDEEEEDFEPPLPPPYIPPKPVTLQKKREKLVKEIKHVQEDSYTSIVSSRYKDTSVYEVIGKSRPSRASQIVSQLKSKQDMVILNEIIGKPKGFR